MNLFGEAYTATRLVDHTWRVFDGGIKLADLSIHVGKILTLHECLTSTAADRETFEIPGNMLAQVMNSHHFITFIELGQ